MKPLFYIFLIGLITCSCRTAQQTTTQVTTSVSDGFSIEKAIKVNNIGEEYEWIKTHYPGSRVMSQALLFVKKKPYDQLNATLPDGSQKSFYFDISSFYGKF